VFQVDILIQYFVLACATVVPLVRVRDHQKAFVPVCCCLCLHVVPFPYSLTGWWWWGHLPWSLREYPTSFFFFYCVLFSKSWSRLQQMLDLTLELVRVFVGGCCGNRFSSKFPWRIIAFFFFSFLFPVELRCVSLFLFLLYIYIFLSVVWPMRF
jgi:hypothetical protein